jgi:hypothetical protein
MAPRIFARKEHPEIMNNQLSQEEIDRMRQLVALHDKANPVKSFDINKPPKEPYTHQEFPRLMYHPDCRIGSDTEGRPLSGKNSGHYVVVNSQEELEAALENGFQIDPPAPKSEEELEAEPEGSDVADAPADSARPQKRKRFFGGK